MFDILFLGTGASVPSRQKGLPCVAVRRGSDIVLFDCGEGSQRQLMISPFSFMKVRAIFITHQHGDHFYGLPGLLQTMGLMGRREPLLVCGPPGCSAALKVLLEVCEGDLEYELDARDVSPGDTVAVKDMTVSVFATDHGIPSQGYVLREPDARGRIDAKRAASLGIGGKDFSLLEAGETVNGVTLADVSDPPRRGLSVAYSGDTRVCQSEKEALAGVDALVHESTYMFRDSELAREHFHSTAADVAEMAAEIGVGHLFLVHVSNRYKDTSPALGEARKSFRDVRVPEDFEMFRLSRSGVRELPGKKDGY